MLKQFKAFAMRGNVIDLAIGVIIGGAFGKIVTSLVNDIITPLLGLLLGKINLAKLELVIGIPGGNTPNLVLGYGQFLQSVLDFLIIAFSIFLFVKAVNSFKKKEEKKEEKKADEPSREEVLLTEIRDLLKEK